MLCELRAFVVIFIPRMFYASNGFEKEARIRDFYDDGVDKIVFRKAIAQDDA